MKSLTLTNNHVLSVLRGDVVSVVTEDGNGTDFTCYIGLSCPGTGKMFIDVYFRPRFRWLC